MLRKLISLLTLLFIYQTYSAQEDFVENDMKNYIHYCKRMIDVSDSLKTLGKSPTFNVKKVFDDAKKIDKNNTPDAYFKKSYEYMSKGHFSESGFMLYLGKMRAEDCKASNFGYFGQNTEMEMLLEEASYLFLSGDLGNYKKVLSTAFSFYKDNNYDYLANKVKNYKKQPASKKYEGIIKLLEKPTPEMLKELQEGRNEMVNRINELYIQFK